MFTQSDCNVNEHLYAIRCRASVDALECCDKEPEDVAEFGADTPMERPAQPEEIAPAFVYFASEADSSYVTGEVLTLLGGETTAG